MKILILTTHLNVGGISSYILNLAKGLKAASVDVSIASSGGDVLNNLKQLNISHYFIDIDTKSELSPKIIKAAFVLKKLIRENKIDVIHSQTRVTQVLGVLVSKMTKITHISTCHGFYKFRLNRKIFPCFGKFVIAVSRQVKDELMAKLNIPEDKIKLIPHGIDIKKYAKEYWPEEKLELRKRLSINSDTFVIGAIGRLAPEKGHVFLVKAFFEVIKKHPNAQLVLVGEGRLKEELVNLVKEENLIDKVTFLGQRHDLENIYPVFDVFCFPSLRESFGFSVLEAFASGLPVIASNIGELRFLIEEGKTGFLCQPAKPTEIASKINYLIENREILAQMSNQAKKISSKDFSLERMSHDTISVYEQALRSK